ncbi:MAG: nucleotidyltransferase family protein [Candidatus Hydrogenedentes bacterium]|nr:nucleotidyltransferase family protein [Candidatus Hydrogenedentota bacterium]
MRAIVLAAGLGTRMRPLTDRTPKCLLPIQGQPQLAYWFYLLHHYGVDKVLVNTHYLHEQVNAYVETTDLPVDVTLVHEPVLLGSAGTVKANRAFVEEEDAFFIAYGDTLMDADLGALLDWHESHRQPATIGLFRSPTPSACGIVELDDNGIVIGFEEKPRVPKSNLAFAGIAVGTPALFDYIPDEVPCDMGSQVFGRMAGRMAGWELRDAYLRDIGTPDSYARAQEEVSQLRVKPA